MKKYVCSICGYVYDEANEKVRFSDLPDSWKCPLCGAPKSAFTEMKEAAPQASASLRKAEPTAGGIPASDMKELSFGELSALCSNLARGCEKQYLAEESRLYTQLADYYKSKMETPVEASFTALCDLAKQNLNAELPAADAEANVAADRGAKRVLLWARKVTTMLQALLERYDKEGDAMLENTNVYVCDVCGFIYIGDQPPEICPVCKVPSFKLLKIGRDA